jgi:hypothetical protein
MSLCANLTHNVVFHFPPFVSTAFHQMPCTTRIYIGLRKPLRLEKCPRAGRLEEVP